MARLTKKDNENLKLSLSTVEMATISALIKHPFFNSNHEAFGVLAEEVNEVLDAIHENNDADAYKEFSQVAAVCIKAMMMIRNKYATPGR